MEALLKTQQSMLSKSGHVEAGQMSEKSRIEKRGGFILLVDKILRHQG